MKRNLYLKNKSLILLLSLILMGLFLRIYKLDTLFYFAIDEEKAAFIINDIINFKHFPSVGHPSSIGFRLGPLLYYLIAPFYKIFGPDPIVWGYISVFASLISMILIYKIGTNISRRTGFYALILYVFSYLNVLYDRRGWQVSFHSLIALTVLYSLIKLKGGKNKYLFLLTSALICASHFEVATLLFIPYIILSFLIFKIKIPRKVFLINLSIFLISHSGLLFFDLRHNFINTKYLINYFNANADVRIRKNLPLTGERDVYLAHNLIPSTLSRTIFSFSDGNTAIEYANCPQYLDKKQSRIPIILKSVIVFILLIFIYLNFKKGNEKEEFILKQILIYFALIFGGVGVYTYLFNGEMAEYYLFSIFAYFFLILGFMLAKMTNSKFKIIPYLFLTVFIYDNSSKLLKSYNPYGINFKRAAIDYSNRITGSSPFMLESFQTCWYSGGYRYLFSLSKKEPVKSYMDQYLNEYYKINTGVRPEYEVVILTPELISNDNTKYNIFRQMYLNNSDFKGNFGEIEVFVRKLNINRRT